MRFDHVHLAGNRVIHIIDSKQRYSAGEAGGKDDIDVIESL